MIQRTGTEFFWAQIRNTWAVAFIVRSRPCAKFFARVQCVRLLLGKKKSLVLTHHELYAPDSYLKNLTHPRFLTNLKFTLDRIGFRKRRLFFRSLSNFRDQIGNNNWRNRKLNVSKQNTILLVIENEQSFIFQWCKKNEQMNILCQHYQSHLY